VLLVGAGLMIKSIIRLQRVNPGFVSEHAVAMDLSLNYSYNEPQKRARFFQELVQRIEALAGVRSAGITDNLPLSGEDASRPFTFVEGSASPETKKLAAEHRRISPHYFDAMGITLVTGRFFTEHDNDQSAAVVIVNETLVRRFLPNQYPIGKRLIIDDGPVRPREIVGVVHDVKHFGLDVAAEPELYVPQLDRPWPNMTLVVRATADSTALVTAIRGEVAAADKGIPVANVKTMDEYVTTSIGPRRFTMFLLGGFAGLALLLVTVGIYGVTSFIVTHRTREIGIRMALGAQKKDVLRLIIWQGTKLTLIGTGIGLIAAFALTRLMRALLFDVSTIDRLTFAGVALLLAGIALTACYIPALRATNVNPSEVLRYE
jgi:putative ABC transport system permease protein